MSVENSVIVSMPAWLNPMSAAIVMCIWSWIHVGGVGTRSLLTNVQRSSLPGLDLNRYLNLSLVPPEISVFFHCFTSSRIRILKYRPRLPQFKINF